MAGSKHAMEKSGPLATAHGVVFSSAISIPEIPRSSVATQRLGTSASKGHRWANQGKRRASCPTPEQIDCFFRKLEPHLSMLYKLLRFRVGDPADIEDVIQETLLQAFSNLDQLRSADCLRAWVIQIAVNEARTILRAKQRTPFLCSIDQSSQPNKSEHFVIPEIADRHETPLEALERAELTAILWQKLATLRPKWRELLLLCVVQELNVHEAARQMGISVADARSSLYRARFALRELLSTTFGEAPQQSFEI